MQRAGKKAPRDGDLALDPDELIEDDAALERISAFAGRGDHPQTFVSKRAHTEWWTAHPPPGRKRRSALPQCCEAKGKSYCAHNAFDTEVPSYVGPAPGNFSWEPSELRAALAGRRVVLFGDSVTQQWSSALSCYLAVDAGDYRNSRSTSYPALEADIVKLGGGKYALPPDWDTHLPGTFVWREMRLPDVGGEVITYVSHKWLQDRVEGFLALHAKGTSRPADLVVINLGAHYNNPETRQLQEDSFLIMKKCQSFGLNCVLRESTPQHFFTENVTVQTGLWNAFRSRTTCLSSKYKEGEEVVYSEEAEWRKIAATKASVQADPGFPVMEVFDIMMPLTFAHVPGDCTHFFMDTEIWEPWHASLFAMLKELK